MSVQWQSGLSRCAQRFRVFVAALLLLLTAVAFSPVPFTFADDPYGYHENPTAHPDAADSPMKLDAGIQASGKLVLEHARFYFKTDEEVRFVAKKVQYQSKNRGDAPPAMMAAFANEAYDEASVEKELGQWRYHGGPAPMVISAKAHLFNRSGLARLNIKLDTTVRVKTAALLVNPKTLLVDFNHLKSSARWSLYSKQRRTIEAMALGEDLLEEVMRFNLQEFLNAHPNQWPTELEIEVYCPDAGESRFAKLELIPDHFVVPELY